MSQDVALPIGRYVVGIPPKVPFEETGKIDSYSGASNIQQNRILSGRMPTTIYNSATPNIRATEENNGGSKPQIVSPTAATGGGGSIHPWQITFREDDGTIQFKVELNSKIYTGLRSWVEIVADGLDVWNNASIGYIVLSGEVANGVCIEANIQGPFESLPERIIYDGDDNQTGFNARIGYIYQDGDGNFLAIQNAFQNFTLISSCVDGIPSIYPFAM